MPSKLIYLDPGHGGKDPGAIGRTYGTFEKDVTLALSLEIEQILKGAGYNVYATRHEDSTVDLVTRSSVINNMKADIAVSIHCNSATDPKPDYFAVYVYKLGGEAEKLAYKVITRVATATGWKWGADDDGIREKDLHMVRETKMPAILIECGFISNPAQEKQLATPDFRKKLAKAIADGIMDYIGREKEGDNMDLDKALQILAQHEITTSPAYWKNAAGVVKYLDSLIINMASKLEGGKGQ